MIKGFEENIERAKQNRIRAEKYHASIRQKLEEIKEGDYVIFENERCKVLSINYDEVFLQHKNHKEEHLLMSCEKCE